jgi:hypothetical protein
MIKHIWMIIHKNGIWTLKAEADFLNTQDCSQSVTFYWLGNPFFILRKKILNIRNDS